MIKMLKSLIAQDMKLLIRNAIFWVISVSLVLIVLTVRFLIPEDFDAESNKLVSYGLETDHPAIVPLESEQAVLDFVRDEGAAGFIGEGDTVTLVHSGLSEKAQKALMVSLFSIHPEAVVEVSALRPNTVLIPQNIRLAPIFICFEALVLGYLLSGILMLSEKEQMTIKAFRVSPAGTVPYVLGKTLLFAALGTLYALLMAVLIVGVRFDWGGFLLLSFLSSALFTLLGLSVTVFFRDMSSWFFTALLILSANMLTMASYSAPSFSPFWIRMIPSYPVIFGFAHILFGSGKGIAGTLLTVTIETVVLFALSCILVRLKLLKSGRSLS